MSRALDETTEVAGHPPATSHARREGSPPPRHAAGSGARRGLAVLAAAALTVGASYAVRLASNGTEARRPQPPATAIDRAIAPGDAAPAAGGDVARDELDRLIRAYRERIRDHTTPSDFRILGALELERARLTGDLDAYGRAEAAFERALHMYPDDLDARILLARVRYSIHDFPAALSTAEEILRRAPGHPGGLALAGDARLAVGDTAGAERAYADLARGDPRAPEVLVRASRLAFLRGDAAAAARGAAAAVRRARASGTQGPTLAFYRAFAAQLAFDRGRYREAARGYRSALAAVPGWYVAQAGLARSLAALGRYEQAEARYEAAARSVPEPSTFAALGDLAMLRGDVEAAREHFRTVLAIARLNGAGGGVYDRQLVLFLADHGRRPEYAVALAEAELRIRSDVHGYDAYAWALYAAGRHDEAREASDRALAPGTPDAMLWYHAGTISAALGEEERAVWELSHALSIGPAFDPVQAERARRTLERLEASR